MPGDEIISERFLRQVEENADLYHEDNGGLDMGNEKRCKRCGLPKLPKEFHRNRYGATGTCKECFSLALRGPRKKGRKAPQLPGSADIPAQKKSRIEELQAHGFRVIVKTIICCPHCEKLMQELKT